MSNKMRNVVVCVALVAAVFATAASGSDSSGSSDGPSKGLGASDATADVSSLTILREEPFVYAQVTIKNSSSKASDYFVTVAAESPDGATRYDDTIVSVNALGSGQTSTEKGIFTKDIPADAVLKLIQVQRTASL